MDPVAAAFIYGISMAAAAYAAPHVYPPYGPVPYGPAFCAPPPGFYGPPPVPLAPAPPPPMPYGNSGYYDSSWNAR